MNIFIYIETIDEKPCSAISANIKNKGYPNAWEVASKGELHHLHGGEQVTLCLQTAIK
jgi:hypothetical protein